MKKLLFLFSFLFVFLNFSNISVAQQLQMDSLKTLLTRTSDDTTKVHLYAKLLKLKYPSRIEKIGIGLEAYEFAKSRKLIKEQMDWGNKTAFSMIENDYFKALNLLFEIKPICEQTKDTTQLVLCTGYIGYAYNKFDCTKSIAQYRICKALQEKAHVPETVMPIYTAMAYAFKDGKMPDSALVYLKRGHESSKKGLSAIDVKSYDIHYGEIYYQMGNKDLAMDYFRKAAAQEFFSGQAYYNMSLIFKERNQIDSAKYYTLKSLDIEKKRGRMVYFAKSAKLLYELYRNENPSQALKYLEIASTVNDSMFSQEKISRVERLVFEEKEKQSNALQAAEAQRHQAKLIAILSILGGTLLLSFVLFRNNRQKQKANVLLLEQKNQIETTLKELKDTQTQLIQKEKMASLGELTAGIAHEIQNPLNFVNNFSELSVGIAQDLKEEMEKPDQDKAYIGELLTDLTQNQEKINHHGKRASNIVKGMLEHSRASSGMKEMTDINALCDEYMRLSYHGMRAKDKSFNADFKMDLAAHLPKIKIVPQDIGRVLLNLINNAFYTVYQKSKTAENYTPSVFLSTEQVDNQIVITVKDNGNGIPDNIKSKIFQPFFTTKPTGEGTGLGLSLSYDIVTKGHDGTLNVESKEREGTIFKVTLPIKT